MATAFVGSEALARGEITWSQLRSRYRSIYPDVYVPRVAAPNLYDHTVGAWLWSERRGVITGRAASAIHGSRWIDPNSPVELLWRNYRPPSGIITRDERFTCDDVVEIDGMPIATPQRAAYDIGRFLPRGTALAQLDALSAATGLAAKHVAPLIDRYPGARHLRRLREVIDLMDGGAQSPKETWLRLLLIDAGFPRPTTQIPVLDDFGHPFAFLDMGWEDLKIAIEYDGEQHRTSRPQYAWDVIRLRRIAEREWLHVKVIKEDRPRDILQRVRQAWATRETAFPVPERQA
ncbi:hypothetical protein TUM20985_11090 [Mycobacterium antarcticum]|uniref:hypothetical protein n=1 Tax=unclassified Mycolicibacterium TaxID=2636767 RepID=UPI0023A5C30B|nr:MULTISPECIES: hypothetical protein [unclassified Mycolicibacterium]BDX30562.1 hypothetical protein TUM20985_11090 [Mycolicibacterium sp. TUM20985]GLP73982.1 hypothetical protein TUM20983_10920 [Mycolicibacterium sp. TUM20983]GLP79686.1 hypothetical protein TUM20984_11060 [Mycolicibacterium sp. TUM20984]